MIVENLDQNNRRLCLSEIASWVHVYLLGSQLKAGSLEQNRYVDSENQGRSYGRSTDTCRPRAAARARTYLNARELPSAPTKLICECIKGRGEGVTDDHSTISV